jgi:hypothetical protein
MTAPADVATRDAIGLILRARRVEMSAAEIAKLLDPQLYRWDGPVLRLRKLWPAEVATHCAALVEGGYLAQVDGAPTHAPTRFMWLPPRPGTRREHELRDDVVLAGLEWMEPTP